MKFLKSVLAASVIAGITATTASANNVNIFVNGKPQTAVGYLNGDTTYVPLRAVSEALGADVSWDGTSNSAYISFDEDNLVTKLVDEISPSVVAIVGNYKSEYMTDTQNKFNELTAHGTGVVIKSGGVILTNAHVVEGIENITVIFQDGSSYAGTVQNIDKQSDLAIVKINKLGLKPVTFASPESITAGKSVIAIGTPLSLSMRNTVTKGIISGVDVCMPDSYYPLIQTDAAINSGNSGGPLINMQGQLIGINSSKYAGVGIEGMAFSIPVETVNYVLSQFEKNGKVLRPDPGVVFENSWEAAIGLPTKKGIIVKSGNSEVLKPSDMVMSVNGVAVHSIVEYNRAIRDTFTGTDKINVTFIRSNETITDDVPVILK